MNIGIIVGTVAVLIGLVALVSAIILRFSNRSSPSHLLRYFFYAGIPILFLTSFAGLWECYRSGDWTKCLVPIGLLFMAINALIVGTRSINSVGGGEEAGESAIRNSRESSEGERP
jgi:peptidoglycan/LPS O-acetylase OafA/YrhL